MALTNPFRYLQANADMKPGAVFVSSAAATLTNGEAVVTVKQLAFEMRRLGVKPGQVVALDLPDHLSILFTEAVFHEAAISTVIPKGHSVEGFDVHWVFSAGLPTPQHGARIVTVDSAFLQHVEENPYGISPSEVPLETLRIVFSSGTTGTPHAIALGREMEQAVDAQLEMWVQGGPSLTLMDTSTAWGMGEFFLSVKGGRPFLCADGASQSVIVGLAVENAVQTVKGSPNQIAALVSELETQQRTLADVRMVVVAGTAMPPGLAARVQHVTEGCAIIVNYGSTEAGGATSRLYASDDPFDAGNVIPGSALEIVDDEDAVVPVGVEGRVRYRSFGMVHEYLGDPEASARAFRDGWFYPGDLGYLRPDGGLSLTGRESEVLNAGGVKVDPSRLDHAALRDPGVLDACSFEYVGESGLRQIGLALVTTDSLDVAALAAALKTEFGSASPLLITRVDSIPRTAVGKPKRRELAEQYRKS